VNSPRALAALDATAGRYPNVRVPPGGPYMDQLNAAVASGEKVAIKFGREGLEIFAREQPGWKAPEGFRFDIVGDRVVAVRVGPPPAALGASNGLNLTSIWRAGNARIPYTPSIGGVLAGVSFALHASKEGINTNTLVAAGAGVVAWELGTRATVKAIGWVAGETAAKWVGGRLIPIVGEALLCADIALFVANRIVGAEATWSDIWDAYTGKLDKPTHIAGPPPPPDQGDYYD
jgi:hypothetical protein